MRHKKQGKAEVAAANDQSEAAHILPISEYFTARAGRFADGLCDTAQNSHEGHRERLRDSTKSDVDLSGLSDIELTELLLSFFTPQRDTNITAHRLIDRYGSVHGVLCAPRDELVSVAGITAQAAAVLPMCFALCFAGGGNKLKIKNRAQAANFFGISNLGNTDAGTYVAFMDDSLTVRAIEYYAGDGVPFKEVLSSASKYCVKYVFAVRREPDLFPQTYNIAAAVWELATLLSDMDVILLDHIILSDHGYYTVGAAPRKPGWYPIYIFVPAVRYIASPDMYANLIAPDGRIELYADNKTAAPLPDIAAQLCAAVKSELDDPDGL